jgi:serine/threonine protein kinase
METPHITLYGGSFIGAGVYGCVVRPPLLCKGQSKIGSKDLKKLAKILDPDDADHELAIARELRKIPMSKNYFIYSDQKEACEPAAENRQIDQNGKLRMDYKESCQAVLKHASLDYYRMYTMPYGGVEYSKFKFDQNVNFWEFGKHLLEALSLLLVYGIVHTDLHARNFVIDDYMVPRIIDWGKATQGPFASAEELSEVAGRPFELKYPQDPPEVPLFIAAYKTRPSIDDAIDEILIAKREMVYELQHFTGIDSRIVKEQLEIFRTKTVFLERNLNYKKWWKAHWHTYDSWGLGVILLHILTQRVEKAPGFLDRREYADTKDKMKSALRGMCNFNCFDRFNAVQALAKWDSPNNHIIRRFGEKWL